MSEVDLNRAVGYKFAPLTASYNRRDLALYALGIGVTDLKYTYELDPSFAAFPTYPLVLVLKGESSDVVRFGSRSFDPIPGVPKFDLNMLVHGEQSLEILNPLPLEGKFGLQNKVVGVYDKGSGLVIEQETLMSDANGRAYCRLISSSFIRGAGGFNGPRGPKVEPVKPPNRDPDAVIDLKTSPSQAMLYRLSGDYNPLHADPQLAKRLKFPAPILHGLCSYGHAAQAILKAFGDNDPSRFISIRARFSAPVIPGETLKTLAWKVPSDSPNRDRIIFVTKVAERDVVVISDGIVELKSAASPKANL